MTRKNYVAIAQALSQASSPDDVDVFTPTAEEMRLDIIGRIADVLAADSPQFKRARFISACKKETK